MCLHHVLFTVVSANSLRYRCGVLVENKLQRGSLFLPLITYACAQ